MNQKMPKILTSKNLLKIWSGRTDLKASKIRFFYEQIFEKIFRVGRSRSDEDPEKLSQHHWRMKVLAHENVSHFGGEQMLRGYDYGIMESYEIDFRTEKIMNRSDRRFFPEKKNIV